VFLDEIGDMPLELQSKLLRVLDRNEFTRVGESSVRRVDVRVVSATNRNLEEMVQKGAFRSDLYFRLRGGAIALAPLRERREDIPSLVSHFLGEQLLAVAPEATEYLQSLEWPGNVRELAMVVANLKGVAGGRVITRDAVERLVRVAGGAAPLNIVPYQDYKQSILDKAEHEYFTTLLRLSGGNMSKAADMAGMHRKNLYEKLKQLDISH
jgi:DNA-binding NtrC family response regulator